MRKISLLYFIMILFAISIATIIHFIQGSNFFITALIMGVLYIAIGFFTITSNNGSFVKKGGPIMYDEFVQIRSEKERQEDFDFQNKKHGYGIAVHIFINGVIVIILSFVGDYIIYLFQ